MEIIRKFRFDADWATLSLAAKQGRLGEILQEGRYIVLKDRERQGVDRLREIAKADVENRLVVLPCKVGDTVYAVFEEQGILSLTVERFLLSENGLFIATPHGLYHTERFGKTLFRTREEAEKALEAHP